MRWKSYLLVAVALAIPGQASSKAIEADVKFSYVGSNFLSKDVYVNICNDESHDIDVSTISGGSFDGRADALVRGGECIFRHYVASGDVITLKLQSKNKSDIVMYQIPDRMLLSSPPWSYVIFLLIGIVSAAISEVAKEISMYPVRVFKVWFAYRGCRSCLIEALDDPRKKFKINDDFVSLVFNGGKDSMFLPRWLIKRVNDTCAAYEIWKSAVTLSPDDINVVRALLRVNVK